MIPPPAQQRRKSLRLSGYDYSMPGAYFVTICTQERLCVFGRVAGPTMELTAAGCMIERWWAELPKKFHYLETDTHIVMPNHLHGILFLTRSTVGTENRGASPTILRDRGIVRRGAHAGAPLPDVVQWFKTMTTNDYIRGVKNDGWPAFRGRLWQRGYYEHVIRNEESLLRIRRYIAENPARWAFDRENPLATEPEPENAWLVLNEPIPPSDSGP